LVQKAVNVDVNDTEESLQERVKLAEQKAYPEALYLIANGHVRYDENTGKIQWKK